MTLSRTRKRGRRMHEHGITDEVVHQIVHSCEDEGIANPKKIIVKLGLLTTYRKEPVLFYFEGHKRELDILKNAELIIEEIEGKIICNNCRKESVVESSPLILCPKCDSEKVEIIQGKDIIIESIE